MQTPRLESLFSITTKAPRHKSEAFWIAVASTTESGIRNTEYGIKILEKVSHLLFFGLQIFLAKGR
jgi:hypothetical protein